MNILISANENYLDKAETMIFSLSRHTEEAIDVYLLNGGLTRGQIDRFEKTLLKESGATLTVIDVDNALFAGLPVNFHLSLETYYRVLAQFLLPETMDRILWLDADIVVVKDIGAFYHQSFDGMKYVVCADTGRCGEETRLWRARVRKEKLGLPDAHVYFNAGVMLMNLALLRQETKAEEILDKCLELKDALRFMDQDLLNALYTGQVKYADEKRYNVQMYGINRLNKEKAEQAAILHYIGDAKPWDYHHMNNASKYYWKARYAQGHRLETVKCYALAVRHLTYRYLCDVKRLFV